MNKDKAADQAQTPELKTKWGSQLAMPVIEQVWRVVLEHRIIIAMIITACVMLGLIATLLATPQFTAKARMEISRKNDNVTNVESVKSRDLGDDLEFYQTQYALLEAVSLAERVVGSNNLIANDAFFEMFGATFEEEDGAVLGYGGKQLKADDRKLRMTLAKEILLENITVAPIRGSSLVDIAFESPDPLMSARIANSWVAQFIASNLDRGFSSNADARAFLEERLSQLRKRLEDSERRLVAYASNKAILTISSSRNDSGKTTSQRTLVAAELEALSTALTEATVARIQAQSEATQRSGATESALTNVTITRLRERRAEIAAERAKLLSQFEPGYPTVKALTSQLAALDSSIAMEEQRVNAGKRNSYQSALAREEHLRNRISRLKGQFNDQRRDTIQYNIFQREVDTNSQLYDGLLQRYKEIGVSGVGANNIAVVDKAEVPDRPSSPRLLVNLALAFIAGIGLSGIYVFAREQIDQSLKDPTDIKNHLGLSLLGIVPAVNKLDIVNDLSDKKSVTSEAYFSIGTNLSFLTSHGAPKSILLTSSRPKEGKSSSAFALAVVMARTGKKILLLDADMRNPSLNTIAGNFKVEGLSNYLSGDSDLAAQIAPLNFENLYLMSSGPIPPNAAELLTGPRMRTLVDTLTKSYDHVIIDAPPVIGLADIPLLARVVEGVIFTIEANGAKIHTIEAAIQRIKGASGNIFGAILTKVDSRNVDYGYGYGYGYGTKDDAA